MEEDPIRADNGKLLCPRCHIALISSKAPFYFKRQYIGQFDAIVCEICRYSLLTEVGYDKAMEATRSFGLVGPAEILSEIMETKAEEAMIQYTLAFSTLTSNLQKDSKKNNKVELENSNEQVVGPKTFEHSIISTKQVLLLKSQ